MLVFPKRKLRIRKITPVNDCSIKSVSNLIEKEEGVIPSQYSSHHKFIPFIRERDTVGRLIKSDSTSHIKPSKPYSYKSPVQKTTSKAKLRQNNYKGSIPPIGSYNVNEKWIKSSFSHKVLSIIPKKSQSNTNIRTTSPQEHYNQKTIKPDETFKRKQYSVPPRKKGIWEELPLYNTPDEMNFILSFKSQKKDIVSHQLSISKSLKKLRDDYYL
jgi:hypothetical protein